MVADPIGTWQGSLLVKKQLADAWEQYQPLLNQRSSIEQQLAGLWRQIEGTLSGTFQRYHRRQPSLSIHLVNYGDPVLYLLPPETMVMAVGDWF